jgi:deoxyribodipyrimidine photolyase-related protein
LLSTSINIGLLQPIEIIKEILQYNDIPINSLEAFIRQLFWREYQRYCYKYYNFDNKNYFGNKKKLSKEFYNGTTGILPVDNCIKYGFDTGYLHHIERLMVVGNYMNLYGIHPHEGYKWFMEFSCDSYEWVMHQNVLDMVFFVSNGDTMRRPYISSSNYILKMSNYKKDKWCDEWDKLYDNFLKKNKHKLWKYRYYFRGLKNV